MSSPHVMHLKLRSIVPRRGSKRPPNLGRSFSIVSGNSILATDMAFYTEVGVLKEGNNARSLRVKEDQTGQS